MDALRHYFFDFSSVFFKEFIEYMVLFFEGFVKMDKNLMDKVSAFGERLKIEGAEVGRKVSAGMSSMSFKVKELFQGPNQADKLVEDATSETLDEPDWALNLEICDMINHEKISSVELIRGIKRRIMMKSPRAQYLSLVLLESCVKNCEKAFSEVAAERVLDEMVKLIDDPQTVVNNRNKALTLIEAWGESTSELRYLPVYEETYKVTTYTFYRVCCRCGNKSRKYDYLISFTCFVVVCFWLKVL